MEELNKKEKGLFPGHGQQCGDCREEGSIRGLNSNGKSNNDADPGQQNLCVVAAMDKFTQTTESYGGKGTVWPLSQEESTPTLALTGFYCFSGHITLRRVVIYYAQVHLRRLQKIKERVLLIT